MTTSFEVRFTNSAEWIAEAEADAQREAIQDGIVRIAVRQVDATLGQIYDKPSGSAPGYDRRSSLWRAHFVEASYVSSRQQLVKLSAYCGVRLAPPVDGEEVKLDGGRAALMDEATRQKVQETIRTLMQACKGLEVRTGALTVEEGAWIANSEEPIAAPPAEGCATCLRPIYYANEQWRHGDHGGGGQSGNLGDFGANPAMEGIFIQAGRAEAFIDMPCPNCRTGRRGRTATCIRCGGRGVIHDGKLHHLADPNIFERMV